MNQQRELGQYMTPMPLAVQMFKMFKTPIKELYVIDPACGDGNLLLSVAKEMLEAGVKDIHERIFGVDIDPEMLIKARLKLKELLGEEANKIKLIQGDFLELIKPSLFEDVIPEKINTVISNPPYGNLREYKFFDACNDFFSPGTEKVFLVPLAFIDRVQGGKSIIIEGKPMGVTTGHVIVHHTNGEPYKIVSTKGNQKNNRDFQVLSGVKLYEVGAGNPTQTKELVRQKPYSSGEFREGWIPCLRTGDIKPYRMEVGRLYIDYGEHLAHPKSFSNFEGPKIFVRRVPIWESRTLAAVYSEDTVLCAGDVLLIRHANDDVEILKGLERFLNSPEAAKAIYEIRPSVLHRVSFPKISGKDLNELFDRFLPSDEELKRMGKQVYLEEPVDLDSESEAVANPSLITENFPIVEVSESCQREKSIRQGHISTLQMWWARRPLAVSRAAIFSALCPTSEAIKASPKLSGLLNDIIPDEASVQEKLRKLVAKLAEWETTNNYDFLKKAGDFLFESHGKRPLVVDTFAGGGSLPVEALRLNLNAFAGEINPVAVTALKVAIELLPQVENKWLEEFKNVTLQLKEQIEKFSEELYGNPQGKSPVAFHWARTYGCPNCSVVVPLFQNKWLSKNAKSPVAFKLKYNAEKKAVEYDLYKPITEKDKADANTGTVDSKGATCPVCENKVTTSWLRDIGRANLIGEELFCISILNEVGKKEYILPSAQDLNLAAEAQLRELPDRRLRNIPDQEFDLNGIRHTWAYQYGVQSTAKLYNNRQSVALLELTYEIQLVSQRFNQSEIPENVKKLYNLLLALLFNRMVLYVNRHCWWQSNGEFPANMFGRQAIPMVWNYVEIPVNSPRAAGWGSACNWIMKIVEQLSFLPRAGEVRIGDAAATNLKSESVDLVAIDPPYYDSIAYSYLSDVFYVWMKEFLNEYPDLGFNEALSPKENEAIVDRTHSLAPNPKDDSHFRLKMGQSLKEAHRILNKSGTLLLMYGHKKVEAWSAIIESVLDAGFEFEISWPIHMERKSKFQHGKVAALSSSCLLVCKPITKKKREVIGKDAFYDKLHSYLIGHIKRYAHVHIFGADLITSLLVPACSLLGKYAVQNQGEDNLSVSDLLEKLPEIIAHTEFEVAFEELSSQEIDTDLKNLILQMYSLYKDKDNSADWRNLTCTSDIVKITQLIAENLSGGNGEEADFIINNCATDQLPKVLNFARLANVYSIGNNDARSTAEAVLGRIGLYLRKQKLEN